MLQGGVQRTRTASDPALTYRLRTAVCVVFWVFLTLGLLIGNPSRPCLMVARVQRAELSVEKF
eukprot:5591511-Prymnesium_polylepis.1